MSKKRPDQIINKIVTLKASSETIKNQIDSTKSFMSKPQIYVLRKRRYKVQRLLRYYKAELKKLLAA